MSLKGVAVPQAVVDYIAHAFGGPEEALLERMAVRAKAAGLPFIMIAPEQARLLGILARAIGARRILDVGTLFGFSAAILAQAVGAEGRVVTLDVDARCTRVAEENFGELGLTDRIQAVTAPALDAMQRMDPDSYDLVLVDADKANYTNYLDESIRLVRPGGLIAFDNVLAFGRLMDKIRDDDPDRAGVEAIRTFNRRVAEDPRVSSILIPIGDGLAVATVL